MGGPLDTGVSLESLPWHSPNRYAGQPPSASRRWSKRTLPLGSMKARTAFSELIIGTLCLLCSAGATRGSKPNARKQESVMSGGSRSSQLLYLCHWAPSCEPTTRQPTSPTPMSITTGSGGAVCGMGLVEEQKNGGDLCKKDRRYPIRISVCTQCVTLILED